MDFSTKYVSTKEAKPVGEVKVVLSNDAYAIGEMIEALINQIEHTRISLMK